MATPTGYDSISHFHEELINHIDCHPTNRSDPFGTTTNNAQHRQNIINDDVKPAIALKGVLQDHVRKYVESLPVDPDHLFLNQIIPECKIVASTAS